MNTMFNIGEKVKVKKVINLMEKVGVIDQIIINKENEIVYYVLFLTESNQMFYEDEIEKY